MSDPSRLFVVLPTYNEAENVVRLVGEILDQPGVAGVVVVDDASPDGTGTLVAGLAGRRPGVHLLSRPGKLGLGTAYLAGFAKARELGATGVVTMDADFSHDPASIPAIAAGLGAADMVIGSRYIPGGGIRRWGIGRRLLSRTANLLARAMVSLGTSDNTSGFRGYRVEALDVLPLAGIRSNGYSFLVEVLAAAHRAGLRISEVPIVFTDRRAGKSKISKTEIWRSIQTLFRLRAARR